ncbi:hypothetical protein PTTG_29119 [Puccinia triticina 1-1 BBBD Race 1]|uniref:Uncharacterized protein n=1 Tax=Puccinia triticina (isolate 1-1 / race 1 (BBBD)) TaxID=630390 RepID=A0A180G6T9_PUCT1|nr:hypothetical protein PTTG_29119 [Puccinia triticina 1-1 BBBD Race 1]
MAPETSRSSDTIPWHKATVKKLTRIIQLTFPSVELKGSPGKALLTQYFKEHVAPVFALHFETTGEKPVADNQNHEDINVDHIQVKEFDPNLLSSTKAIIGASIRKVNPQINTRNLNKGPLIALFYQVYNLSPFQPVRPFSVVAAPIGSPLLEQQRRNQIRFALQCYFPNLFVPLECNHRELVAIYELFILEDRTHENWVQENTHYYWSDPNIPAKYLVSPFACKTFGLLTAI